MGHFYGSCWCFRLLELENSYVFPDEMNANRIMIYETYLMGFLP